MVLLAWSLVDHPVVQDDALAWAVDAMGALGFGGWWFTYVVRPIFLALVLSWLWRMLLVAYWFWRVGRLGLSLVPTHPDRTGGLAFVEKVPGAFALVTFALSAVIASRWAHEVAHHDAALRSFMQPALAFVVLWTLCWLMGLEPRHAVALSSGVYMFFFVAITIAMVGPPRGSPSRSQRCQPP